MYTTLTAESITRLRKKKAATKRVAQNWGEFEQASCSRNTTCGGTAEGNIPSCPAKQTLRKNSDSSTAHLNASATAEIWSGKTMTYTVLSPFYFSRVSQQQQVKGATAFLPPLLCRSLHHRHLLHKQPVDIQPAYYSCVFISPAFPNKNRPLPLLSNSTNINIRSALYLCLRFACRHCAQNTEMITSSTFHWVYGK